jgi:uncharacterized protein (DUF1800 family)
MRQLLIAASMIALAGPAVAAPAPLKPADLALLNRVTWGANAADAAQLASLGPERWLQRQLRPPPGDPLPPAAQAQIDALQISHEPLAQLVAAMDAQNKAANQIADPDQKKAAQSAYQQAMTALARQAATREILRDLYSPDQLKEQLTWFWFNHFNVHQYKANLRVLVGDYEETALRPHALGRFRDLLEATLRHPAMLRYLDNADNAAGHINENYAREIMELHTLGVGSGYTQKDVQELARILTGVGIDANPVDPKLRPDHAADLVRDGLFEFNPNRHDYGDKVFLGHTIKGRGFGEVEEALDLIARSPATASHVSSELAVYFVADDPPPALVQRMAATFQHSDGDIADVLSTLFHSPEFKASLGHKFKDPAHYAISAVRLAYGDKVILNTGPIQGWLGRLAEGLYNHETPDGYSMAEPAWDGPGQMALRFEIARQIGSGGAGLFKPDQPGATDQPGFPTLQNALYYDGLADTLGGRTQGALAQATSPQEWNTLFLASPEFMHR